MIKPTELVDGHTSTHLVCDNAECGHGYNLTTNETNPMPHSDAIVRMGASQRGWVQTEAGFDLCSNCAPSWTPDDGIKGAKAPPTKIQYGNGVWGWSHRIAGPTKTGQSDV